MNITVNGSSRSIQGMATIADLIDNLQLPSKSIVVELNTSIIPPDAYPATQLADGDQVEIIRFVGGG